MQLHLTSNKPIWLARATLNQSQTFLPAAETPTNWNSPWLTELISTVWGMVWGGGVHDDRLILDLKSVFIRVDLPSPLSPTQMQLEGRGWQKCHHWTLCSGARRGQSRADLKFLPSFLWSGQQSDKSGYVQDILRYLFKNIYESNPVNGMLQKGISHTHTHTHKHFSTSKYTSHS